MDQHLDAPPVRVRTGRMRRDPAVEARIDKLYEELGSYTLVGKTIGRSAQYVYAVIHRDVKRRYARKTYAKNPEKAKERSVKRYRENPEARKKSIEVANAFHARGGSLPRPWLDEDDS